MMPSRRFENAVLNSLSSEEIAAFKQSLNIRQIRAECDRELQAVQDGAPARIEAAKQAIAERRKKREQQKQSR
jgi:hypothetical protein